MLDKHINFRRAKIAFIILDFFWPHIYWYSRAEKVKRFLIFSTSLKEEKVQQILIYVLWLDDIVRKINSN